MSETFEEVVAREVDGLYQEALFLAGGSGETAEDFLVRTFARSFRSFAPDDGEDAGRWLEGRLVEEFLAAAGGREPLRTEGPEERPRVSGDPPDPDDLDPNSLHRAAARLPPGPRAVIWLVLFGRWTYEEVERLLDVDRAVVRELLQYRHILLAEVLGAGWGRPRRRRTDSSGHVG